MKKLEIIDDKMFIPIINYRNRRLISRNFFTWDRGSRLVRCRGYYVAWYLKIGLKSSTY